MLNAVAYLIGIGFSSLLVANYLERNYLKVLAVDAPRVFMAQAVFFLTIFTHSFVFLAFGQFTKPLLAGSALVWTLSWVLIERKKLSEIFTRATPAVSTRSSSTKLEGFFLAGIIAMLCISGVVYFYPGTIGGDSDKAYLAIAKFFARGKSLLLQDPVVIRDAQGLRGFPYFEEIYLAAGYALDGNFGAKLFAWLIVASKFSLIYFVAQRILCLSRAASLGLVLCFSQPNRQTNKVDLP